MSPATPLYYHHTAEYKEYKVRFIVLSNLTQYLFVQMRIFYVFSLNLGVVNKKRYQHKRVQQFARKGPLH